MSESNPLAALAAELAPAIGWLWGPEVALEVSDTKKYLYYRDGLQLKLPISPGDEIREGSLAGDALRTNSRIFKAVGAEVFGIPYQGICVPIQDPAGLPVGTIGIAVPTSRQDELRKMAQQLESATGLLGSVSSNLAGASQQLAAASQELAASTGDIGSRIKSMDALLSLIREVASQTHLLGLNAAIESARAGAYGRGFTVVAEEIRKLAARTNNSVKEINATLLDVRENTSRLAAMVDRVSSSAGQQAGGVQEIVSAIQEINVMAGRLTQLAKDLLI
ncbi:MAG: methyl-accepting chemotaxis protein [Bacillota bacterium]